MWSKIKEWFKFDTFLVFCCCKILLHLNTYIADEDGGCCNLGLVGWLYFPIMQQKLPSPPILSCFKLPPLSNSFSKLNKTCQEHFPETKIKTCQDDFKIFEKISSSEKAVHKRWHIFSGDARHNDPSKSRKFSFIFESLFSVLIVGGF